MSLCVKEVSGAIGSVDFDFLCTMVRLIHCDRLLRVHGILYGLGFPAVHISLFDLTVCLSPLMFFSYTLRFLYHIVSALQLPYKHFSGAQCVP